MTQKCTCPPPGPFHPLPDYYCPLHGGKAVDGFEVSVHFGPLPPNAKRRAVFSSKDLK